MLLSINKMPIYKVQVGDMSYIGSTYNFHRRLRQHNYRLSDPPAQQKNCHTKFYRKLREMGIDTIDETICSIIDEGNGVELEQHYIDEIPKEQRLNSCAAKKM